VARPHSPRLFSPERLGDDALECPPEARRPRIRIVAWAYAVAYLLGFAFARARIYPQARSSVISGYYYLFAFIIAFGPVCAMAELFRGESIYFSMAVAAFTVMVPVGYGAQNGLLRVPSPGRGEGGADIAGDPAEGAPGRQLSQGGSVSVRPES
jgi:hypothetical protein